MILNRSRASEVAQQGDQKEIVSTAVQHLRSYLITYMRHIYDLITLPTY